MDVYLTKDGADKISPILHKYYKIDDRFFDVLRNNAIWFADPLDFNDPYDCNLFIDSENTYEEILDHLNDVSIRRAKEFQRQRKIINQETILYSAKHWYENPNKLKDYLKDNQLNEIERKGIACFSKSDKILLMWSHYANSHKGSCITFDILKDADFFAYPFNVEYPPEYPKINFIREKDIHRRYKHVLAMKSKDWEYEQEVRIVKDKRDHPIFRGNVPFNKPCLREIKFGYKADVSDIKRTKHILTREGYGHVKLYKAELVHGQFGINFNEIG